MENKKEILKRTYIIYLIMVVFALAIVYRIFQLQVLQGEELRAKAKEQTTQYVNVDATRGNIFDSNGNLIATSLPYYEVAVDINAPSILTDTFNKYVGPLAKELAALLKDKTEKEYLKILKNARKDHDRYVVLKRNVSHEDLQLIKKFPILKRGKKGGLVYLQTNKRELPFKTLAARTIGYKKDKVAVGIEGAFDTTLRGISGKRLMQKVAPDVWRPINDENEIDPKDGNDVYTTLDINVQDVTENALLKQLIKNKADHGCVVLMEVKTGAIKAIANLTRSKKDSAVYYEDKNYAIGDATEPGSTFKLGSMLAALEDGYIDLDDKFHVGNGSCMYYNQEMKDSHDPEAPDLSAQRIFEVSSNVGVSKIITKYYSKDPQKFLNHLYSFGLSKPLGITIPGEGKPKIKKAGSAEWYGPSLAWISIGYESLVTPIQTLTLYNAIANNGVMVKPRFVDEIKKNGKTVQKFEPEIVESFKLKPSTIKKAQQLCEGVVTNGTGKELSKIAFKVAGKTGTAQIANGASYGFPGQHTYQASFVGYFPADNPKYSCIIIVNSPSNGLYYGGLVAGPIFKEIAEKVFSTNMDFQKEINAKPNALTKMPSVIKNKSEDLEGTLTKLNIPHKSAQGSKWASTNPADSSKIDLQPVLIEESLEKGIVPNLIGLSGRDAVYLLENKGFTVQLSGFGTVKKQSIEAGKKFNKGSFIVITLG